MILYEEIICTNLALVEVPNPQHQGNFTQLSSFFPNKKDQNLQSSTSRGCGRSLLLQDRRNVASQGVAECE